MKHYDNIKKLRRNNRLLAIFIISFVIGASSIVIYLTAKLVESVL